MVEILNKMVQEIVYMSKDKVYIFGGNNELFVVRTKFNGKNFCL